jgi:CRP/FNR family transcriptional regulator, cyclic AMP receptor protein
MTAGDPLKLLKNVPFLSKIKPAQLKEIADISKIHVFKKKTLVFSKSEAADHMFIVVSGRIKIFTFSESRLRKTFAYLTAGQFFGEMALLGTQPRSASAEAIEESRLLVISRRDFNKLLLHNPDLTYYLLHAVADRLRRSNQEVENLLFKNVLGRVSRVLCDLAKGSATPAGHGLLLKEAFTHQELADLVGTAREPLTRGLAKLRRLDLVDVREGRFFIKDPKKLAALAGD